MNASSGDNRESRFAAVALGAIALQKASASIIFILGNRFEFDLRLALNIQSVLAYWLLPFVLAYVYEGRGLRSLGLTIDRKNRLRYALYTVVALVAPMFLLGFRRQYLVDLVEQIAFIGMAEEVLWRGYLQARLMAWLGNIRGLLLTAFLFGLGHIVTILSRYGAPVFPNDLFVFLQTSAGGVILGYIFYRSKSVIPGSLFHIFGNVYLFQIVELL